MAPADNTIFATILSCLHNPQRLNADDALLHSGACSADYIRRRVATWLTSVGGRGTFTPMGILSHPSRTLFAIA
jgi:hypothetical protein